MTRTKINLTWTGLIVVLIFLLASGWHVYNRIIQNELKMSFEKAKNELGFIAVLIKPRLQEYDYQSAERFIFIWGERNSDILEIILTSKNNKKIAHYNSLKTAKHKIEKDIDIPYSYDGIARIKLKKNLDQIYNNNESLRNEFLVGYLFISIVLFYLTSTLVHTSKQKNALVFENSQRIRAEKELTKALNSLQEREQNLDITLHSIGDAVITTDINGFVSRMNPVAERLTGWSFQEAKGELLKNVFNVFDPHTREVIDCSLEKIYEEDEKSYFGQQCLLISKDNDEYTISNSSAPIKKSDDEILGVILVFNDITERINAETELKLTKDTLDNTLDAVFMYDPVNYQFFYINRGAINMMGYNHTELIGMGQCDIMPLMTGNEFQELVTPLISSDRDSLTFETVYRDKSKQDIPVEIFLQFLTDPEPGHFLAIVRDITDRKRAEQKLQQLNYELENRVENRTIELAKTNNELKGTLETLQQAQDELVHSEKLASLGSLVAGIAHELNTPLGNAVTLSSLMSDWLKEIKLDMENDNLTESSFTKYIQQTEDSYELLTRSLRTAADLINDFKQVAVDQTSERRRQFNLQRVIIEVVETIQPQFKKTPHKILLNIPEEIEMDSYPGPLGQVITNLTLNALFHGFSDNMNGCVNINAQLLSDQTTKLTVEDNGCGIPPEHISKVFDPFFTTKMGKGGSGLGMHIVYSLVAHVLGGSIKISSSSTGGTLITILLPLTAPVSENGDEFHE